MCANEHAVYSRARVYVEACTTANHALKKKNGKRKTKFEKSNNGSECAIKYYWLLGDSLIFLSEHE